MVPSPRGMLTSANAQMRLKVHGRGAYEDRILLLSRLSGRYRATNEGEGQESGIGRASQPGQWGAPRAAPGEYYPNCVPGSSGSDQLPREALQRRQLGRGHTLCVAGLGCSGKAQNQPKQVWLSG